MSETNTAPARSRNTTSIACKLPHGLIVRVYQKGEGEDGKPVMVAASEPLKLNGANDPGAVFGFGMTEVDTETWEAWLKQNANFPAVKNGLIVAQPNSSRAIDQAKDHQTAKTGVEPIDPEKPAKGIEPVPKKELRARAASA